MLYQMFPRFSASGLLVAGLVGLMSTACAGTASRQPRDSGAQQISPSPSTSPIISNSISSPTTPVPASPTINPFDLGMDKAASAISITNTAQSEEDWNLAADQWLQAIDLMKRVPPASPYQAMAKRNVVEYERQLAYAKQQAKRLSTVANPAPTVSLPKDNAMQAQERRAREVGTAGSQSIYRAKIKRRAGNTPVIEVVFNGKHRFEMVVDTGASATVITQQMASVLGIVPVDVATVDTASARDVQVPLGFTDSIEAGGLVSKNVAVMIAGPELDIGLLGHNFYGDYDITIKRDVVEFHPR